MSRTDYRPGLSLKPSDRDFIQMPGHDKRVAEQEERHRRILQAEADARQLRWCRVDAKKKGLRRHDHYDTTQ